MGSARQELLSRAPDVVEGAVQLERTVAEAGQSHGAARGLDVDGLRVGDARAPLPYSFTGWKGKGLWTTVSTRTPFHMEGGKGTTSKVVKFQLRPDPLTK